MVEDKMLRQRRLTTVPDVLRGVEPLRSGRLRRGRLSRAGEIEAGWHVRNPKLC